MPKLLDLKHETFGRLVVRARVVAAKPVTWRCRCECGAEVHVASNSLRSGKVRSCGCLRVDMLRARARHGFARKGSVHPLHRIWRAMLQRCYNPKDRRYPTYGQRGIRVSRRWHKFENFLADVGERPSGYTRGGRAAFSIDRPNNNKSYGPTNFRWATTQEQARNTTRVVRR